MGTRSLTFVGDDRAVVCMYRQMDGYPSGHGMDLYNFLKNFRIVNGIGADTDAGQSIANGAGCLAAQLVANFKDGPGGIYLYPTDVGDVNQEYEYYVSASDETGILIECVVPYFKDDVRDLAATRVLYRGDLDGFKIFCEAD